MYRYLQGEIPFAFFMNYIKLHFLTNETPNQLSYNVYGRFSLAGLVLPVQSEIIQSRMIQSENDLVQDNLVQMTVQSRRHFSPDHLVHMTFQSQTVKSRMIQSKIIQSRTFQSRRLFSPEDILVQMIQSKGLFSPDNLVQMTVQSQTFQYHLNQSQPIQSKTFQSLTKNYDQLFFDKLF